MSDFDLIKRLLDRKQTFSFTLLRMKIKTEPHNSTGHNWNGINGGEAFAGFSRFINVDDAQVNRSELNGHPSKDRVAIHLLDMFCLAFIPICS